MTTVLLPPESPRASRRVPQSPAYNWRTTPRSPAYNW
jgi:hypothetical protein